MEEREGGPGGCVDKDEQAGERAREREREREGGGGGGRQAAGGCRETLESLIARTRERDRRYTVAQRGRCKQWQALPVYSETLQERQRELLDRGFGVYQGRNIPWCCRVLGV